MIMFRKSMQSEGSREPRTEPSPTSFNGWVVGEKEPKKDSSAG